MEGELLDIVFNSIAKQSVYEKTVRVIDMGLDTNLDKVSGATPERTWLMKLLKEHIFISTSSLSSSSVSCWKGKVSKLKSRFGRDCQRGFHLLDKTQV
ncbi:Uncharacterized protein TCM_045481 [Theobroma cacao]|uniref:Uncharacterized protein n=1 Tax=Theobroma cacao TaxID=3641 RepID=A0A061FTH3_THECC|nr:Uncharacterized protein TCM_045481 [Theobroma cacao]